ncbi:MAG: ATP-binding protein [Candidatus Anammoxibacter sp.]
MKTFKRIDKKLLFYFLTVTLLLLGIGTFIAYNNGAHIAKKQTLDYLRQTAISLKGHIYTFIKAQKNIARDFASDNIMIQSLNELNRPNSNSTKIIERLKKHVMLNKMPLYAPDILGISVLNHNGNIVFSTYGTRTGKNESKKKYFSMVKNEGYFGDIHYSKNFYEPVIEVSAPIIDQDSSTFLGVIVNVISGSTLSEVTQSHWIGELGSVQAHSSLGGYFYGQMTSMNKERKHMELQNSNDSGNVYIVNSKKRMIALSRSIDNTALDQEINTKPVQLALNDGNEMVGIYKDYKGISIIGASVLIKELKWVILAEKDISSTLAPLFRLRAQMITLWIVALGVVIAVATMIAKNIANPILALTKATQRRAAGDLNFRLEITSDDELGTLTDSFNKMCDDIDNITVSKGFLEKIFSGINESLILTDTHFKIKKVNRAALDMLGYNESELIDKPIAMILEENRLFLDSIGIQELIKYEQVLKNQAVVFKTKNGEGIPVSLSATIIKDCIHKQHPEDCSTYIKLLACGNCEAIKLIIISNDMRPMNTLIQKEKERIFELTTIQEISRQLYYTLNYDDLFRLILTPLHKSINFDIAGSVLCNDPGDLIYIKQTQLIDESVLDWYKDNLLKTFSKLSVKGHEDCKKEFIDISMDEEKFSSEQGAANSVGSWQSAVGNKQEVAALLPTGSETPVKDRVKSYFNVPLIVREQIVGIINISSFKENAFGANHIRMLYTIANQVTISIQHLITLVEHEKGKLSSILRDMVDGVIILDRDGIMEMVNPAGTKLVRLLSVCKQGERLDHLGDYYLKEPMELIINKEKDFISHNLSFSNEAQELTISMIIAPVKGKTDIEGMIIVLRDITKETNLQQQLLHSEKLSTIGEMVSGIAHEINNPLAGIMGLTQLLQIQPDLPEAIRKNVDKIFSYTDRARRIIQNLLTFSRAHKPEKTSVKINELISQTIEMLDYNMKIDDIEIVNDFDPDLPNPTADMYQLQQVFFNIINNAHQALSKHEGTRILTVKTTHKPGYIVISIHNTGSEIPSETIKKIFNPFFTTKEVGKGTGMGLSIAYGIIKEHGGNIFVNSEKGHGVTFLIRLPIDNIKPEDETEIYIQPEVGISHIKILIVDDEIAVAESVSALLQSEGHTCQTSPRVDEAIEKLSTNDFDLIISDVKMPGMDGKEFYEYLKSNIPKMTNRFITITGDVMNDETKLFIEKNNIPCLAKPFTHEELKNVILEVIKKWGAKDTEIANR